MSERTVIVCGTRDGIRGDVVLRALGAFDHDQMHLDHVVVGSTKGVDGEAAHWAYRHGRILSIVPAKWDDLGKRAGPARNELMIAMFDVHAVLAFPGGAGTASMVGIARRARVALWHCVVRGEHWNWVPDQQEARHG